MKKKIAVVFNRMIVGGAEKACINFLKAIDKSKYEVSLFTYVEGNPCIKDIPDDVMICDIAVINPKQELLKSIKRMQIGSVVKGVYCRIMCRFARREYSKTIYAQKSYSLTDTLFDCAIAYKANHPDTAATLYSIRAKKKAAIVHSDLPDSQSVVSEFGPHFERFDRIFCVSDAQSQRTRRIYPALGDRIKVMYNVMDIDPILELAMDTVPQLKNGSIVTVGRLSPEKGQQMIPETVRILLDQGYDIHWYLVGDGPLRPEVEQECEKYGVQDRVILLGTKMNPYPYIKNCNIYVQPSFTEGYCTTTVEAKILCKPIVTTDAPGMREQFVSGENGLIVDAMTPEAIAEGIRQLLDHPELMEKFRNALKNESVDNSAELQKLYDFIES